MCATYFGEENHLTNCWMLHFQIDCVSLLHLTAKVSMQAPNTWQNSQKQAGAGKYSQAISWACTDVLVLVHHTHFIQVENGFAALLGSAGLHTCRSTVLK
jgi:hypothetical protein